MNRLSHLNRTASLGLLVFAMPSAPAMAQRAPNDGEEINEATRHSGRQDIVVTAMRTNLPITALPVTVDIVDAEGLASQVSMSGSTVAAISALGPTSSPTRPKLYGA